MPKATCALCGAENPVSRVYVAMKGPTLNFLGLSCKHCGKVGSQMFAFGEYAAFAVIYGLIASVLIVVGMMALPESVDVEITATIAAVLPWTFLPAWWSSRQSEVLANAAPREDLRRMQKVLYALSAIAIIAAIVGAVVFLYVYYVNPGE